LLHLLRGDGGCQQNLNVVQVLDIAFPAWSDFLSIELIFMGNSLLKHTFKYSYSSSVYTLEAVGDDADKTSFKKTSHE